MNEEHGTIAFSRNSFNHVKAQVFNSDSPVVERRTCLATSNLLSNVHLSNHSQCDVTEEAQASTIDATGEKHQKQPWTPVEGVYSSFIWLGKRVFIKATIIFYLSIIFYTIFRECDPWYQFFFYLTLQGWTIELIYFCYTLYMDVLSFTWGNSSAVEFIATATGNALSELVLVLQIVIVVFFWTVIYPQEPWRSVAWELNCHGMGLALIVGDYLYHFPGFSLRNHKYILFFSFLYTCLYLYVIFYLKRSVYPGIDFQNARSSLIFIAGLSSVILTHKIVSYSLPFFAMLTCYNVQFYLITKWKYMKDDWKTVLGVATVILVRQNSVDILVRNVSQIGKNLLFLPQSSSASAPKNTAL